jgi:protein-export membrane protein SecD
MGMNMPFTGKEYKLGLDLQWGVELDYKVDLDEAKEDPDYSKQMENDIVEWLKRIIDKRVGALNINDSVITSASYGSEKHIIVQIPLKGKTRAENDANIQRAKDAIGKVVKIEFREARLTITDEDIAGRETIAGAALAEIQLSEYDFFVSANKIRDNNDNVKVGTLTGSIDDVAQYFSLDSYDTIWLNNSVVSGTWVSEFDFDLGFDLGNIIPPVGNSGYYVLENISLESDWFKSFNYLFVDAQPSEWMPAADTTGRVLNDKYFIKSSVQYTEAWTPLIELSFNDEGAQIFGELTKRLVNNPIAIFVWGELLTSPNVNEPILNGRAVITGNYSIEEATTLSNDINTWVVPAAIYLTSERSIDSKLWEDSLQKLFMAWVLGFIIIYAFLIYIYRLSWVFAWLTLFIYLVLVLAIVKVFGTVLTLASVAGLILSLGMAIDANILIFERIKDEIKKQAKLKTAITRWFDSSWSAIWDSNLTGLIVSMILYIFGINIIKWFGLMLGIGIVVSLFSAMFISRLFIVILSEKKDLSLKNFIWYWK